MKRTATTILTLTLASATLSWAGCATSADKPPRIASTTAASARYAPSQPLLLASDPAGGERLWPGFAWHIELHIPEGQAAAGTYSGTMTVLDVRGDEFTASVEDWSNGARSRLHGWRRGAHVHLDRVDNPPHEGFRATFDGTTDAQGIIDGLFRNDASAPWGNDALGTWRAVPAEPSRAR